MNKDKRDAIEGSLLAVAYILAFLGVLWVMLP